MKRGGKEDISKKELLEILSVIKPGVSQKGIIEQSSHFVFTREEILTYNDQICVSYPFSTDFKCSVDAKDLFGILSGCPEEKIKAILEDNKLLLSGREFKAGLSISTEETIYSLFSALKANFKGRWKALPPDLLEGLSLCVFSASTDSSLRELTGVQISDNFIISSDDLRISRYRLKKGIGRKCLVPAKAVSELQRYDFVEYKIDLAWIHFCTKEQIVFSIRLIEELLDFEVEQHFKTEGVEITFPEKLLPALDTVSVMADGEFDFEKRIEFLIDGDKLSCRGQKEAGWAEMQLKGLSSGKENSKFSFSINPIFLKQILQKTNTIIVGEDKAWFKVGNFEHVMMIRRLEGKDKRDEK